MLFPVQISYAKLARLYLTYKPVRSITQSALVLGLLPFAIMAQSGTTANNRWRIHGWLGGDAYEAECTFRLRVHMLTGYCTTEQGTTDITGQSSGSTILWSYEADLGGASKTLQFSGILNGRKMNGKIGSNENPNAGTFKADMVR